MIDVLFQSRATTNKFPPQSGGFLNSVPFITGMLGLLHECHKQMIQCGNVFRLTRVSERLVAHDDLILIDFKTLAFNLFSPPLTSW